MDNGVNSAELQALLDYYEKEKGISRDARKGERVDIVKGEKRRRLHKAFLRYHDPNNWPLLREGLAALGREDLIGPGKSRLVPHESTRSTFRSKGNKKGLEFRTQHTRKR